MSASTAPEAMLSAMAQRRVQLKPNVEAFRHVYRGRPWYVFHDRAAHRFYRVSLGGAEIIGAMNGRRTLGEICAGKGDGGRPVDPGAAMSFVMQLNALGLLRQDGTPDTAAMSERRGKERSQALAAQLRTPLSFKIPLFDPTRLVDAILPWCAWMFRPIGVTFYLTVVLIGAIVGIIHWQALTENFSDRLFTAQNLLLMWFVYPFVKAMHEMMHAITLRRLGVEVRQIGLLFAAFIPVPYVDATASATLERKSDRMLIGAAGILVELFVGAVALMVWASSEPGLLHAICYNVIMISGFSTLLFNGNPLQRYDGYYILADAVEIPGLGTRSGQYLTFLFQRYVLGRQEARAPLATSGEKAWFVIYGPISFIYRFGLMLVIALYVAEFDQAIGLLIATWSVVGYVWPMLTGAFKGARTARNEGGRLRAYGGLGGLGLALALLLFLLPMPNRLVVQGFVTMPEESILRAQVGAMMAELAEPDGAMVTRGQPIGQLVEPAVLAKVDRLLARNAELEARFTHELTNDRVRAANAADALAHAVRELADARRDQAALVLRSPAAGQLVFSIPTGDLTGRFLGKGEQLGMIYRPEDAIIRALIPMSEIDLVRGSLR
ncbi:MAG: hypothetical protein WCP77_01735, partial [Roseococcus sp.]